MHWRKATVCRLAFFSSWVWGRGFKEGRKNYRGLRGPDGELVFSSLHEKTFENHFYKGGVFLCSGAWPQYARLQFFPHGTGEGVPRNALKIYGGLWCPDGDVVIHIVRKNGRKSLFSGWPQYAGLQFFPHGSGKGVPRNVLKMYAGLRCPDGDVVIDTVRKNVRKSLL